MNPGFLVLDDKDNVGVALRRLAARTRLDLPASCAAPHRAASLTVMEDIPMGHKFALSDLAAGDPILKYGAVMGVATAAIGQGRHVHMHNVESRRGRGDLS